MSYYQHSDSARQHVHRPYQSSLYSSSRNSQLSGTTASQFPASSVLNQRLELSRTHASRSLATGSKTAQSFLTSAPSTASYLGHSATTVPRSSSHIQGYPTQGSRAAELPNLASATAGKKQNSPAMLRRAGSKERLNGGRAEERTSTTRVDQVSGLPGHRPNRPLPELSTEKKVRRKSSLRKPDGQTTERSRKPSVRFSETETILSSGTHIGVPGSTAPSSTIDHHSTMPPTNPIRRVGPLKPSQDVDSHIKPGSRLADRRPNPLSPPEPSPLLPPSHLLTNAEPSSTMMSKLSISDFSPRPNGRTVDSNHSVNTRTESFLSTPRTQTVTAVQQSPRQQVALPSYAQPTMSSMRNSKAGTGRQDLFDTPRQSKALQSSQRFAPEKISMDGMTNSLIAGETHPLPPLSQKSSGSSGSSSSSSNPMLSRTSTDSKVGLSNIGNTCYMNSILQCLSHTVPLRRMIFASDLIAPNSPKSFASQKAPLSTEFAKLISQLWSGGTKSVAPAALKSQVVCVARQFQGQSQQDANEFFRFLLDGIHQELNAAIGPPMKLNFADIEKLGVENQAREVWLAQMHNENSIIMEIFGGQLRSTLMCQTCSRRSYTFDLFWDLPVPIPNSPSDVPKPSNSRAPPSRRYSSSFDNLGMSSNDLQKQGMSNMDSSVSIYDCLDLFTQREVLSGQNRPYCENCKAHRDFTKQFSVQRLPSILVLNLKRFEASKVTRRKISKLVRFDEELDMASFTSGEDDAKQAKYQLYAICNHTGSVSSGHYRALCQNLEASKVSRRWQEFDDSSVHAFTGSRCTPMAYMLFYQRKL